jgi:hypothetical protein
MVRDAGGVCSDRLAGNAPRRWRVRSEKRNKDYVSKEAAKPDPPIPPEFAQELVDVSIDRSYFIGKIFESGCADPKDEGKFNADGSLLGYKGASWSFSNGELNLANLPVSAGRYRHFKTFNVRGRIYTVAGCHCDGIIVSDTGMDAFFWQKRYRHLNLCLGKIQ